MEYYQKLFVEVSKCYDTKFTNPIQSAEEWIKELTVCTTLNQFMRKFLKKNLQNDDRKFLYNKYSRLLENEKITEGASLKRVLVSYYDKLIDAGLHSLNLDNNSTINKELLNFYKSINPVTEEDIERFKILDPNLSMNTFVYKVMDINMLRQLIYERYTQYDDVKFNKTTRFMKATPEPEVDDKVTELIDKLIKESTKKTKKEVNISNFIETLGKTQSGRNIKATDKYSPSQYNNTTIKNNSKKRNYSKTSSSSIGSSLLDGLEEETDDDNIEKKKDERINNHDIKKKEKQILINKVQEMNKKIKKTVQKCNEELKITQQLFKKKSNSFIIRTENGEEASVGDGLFCHRKIKAGEEIQYYNGKYIIDMVYSCIINDDPTKGDYAIQVSDDIVYDCYENAINDQCLASKSNSAELLYCKSFKNAKNKKDVKIEKCEYNAKIAPRHGDGLPLFVIVATNDIDANHEILTRYTMYDDVPFFKNSSDYIAFNNDKKLPINNEDVEDKKANDKKQPVIDLCNDDFTAMESFNLFMKKTYPDDYAVVQDSAGYMESKFESFQNLLKVHNFVESIDKRFPIMISKFKNNKQALFNTILLEIGCQSSNSTEFLTGLMSYFFPHELNEEMTEDDQSLLQEIHFYHIGLMFVLNDYMVNKIFQTTVDKNTDFFKEKIIAEVDNMKLTLTKIEYTFMKQNKSPLFDSICKDAMQQSTCSIDIMPTIIIIDDDHPKPKKVKKVKYDPDVDYFSIINDVKTENYIYHKSFNLATTINDSTTIYNKPTVNQLLIRRKQLPHDYTFESVRLLLTKKLKSLEPKCIFDLLDIDGGPQNIYGKCSRLMVTGDCIKRFHKNGWLNNHVIDRTIAMFIQHLQACHLKDPQNDLRIKQYQFFYTDKMFYIRRYDLDTKIFYSYMYQDHWYKSFQDLFEKHFLVYPVNMLQEHWFLIVVYMLNREIIYYDSLGYNQMGYVEVVEKSLADEAFMRKREDLVDMETRQFIVPFIKTKYEAPRQTNGFDCGVFLIMMINFLIDNIPFNELKQEDMPLYRLILAADIIRQKINYYAVEEEEEEDNNNN